LMPCANPSCALLMGKDYLCKGCYKLVHWFCAVGDKKLPIPFQRVTQMMTMLRSFMNCFLFNFQTVMR
jgi:hypothetical protein